MTDPYRPIDCSLHDRLEEVAVRRRPVVVRYDRDDGDGSGDDGSGDSESSVTEIEDVIVDWFVRDGAEYLRTQSGVEIRLDRLHSVDGVSYR